MNVPVEYNDPPVAESPVLPGSHGHVVEEAEAKRLAVLSVMARRSDQTKSIAETAGAHFVDQFYDGPSRHLGGTGSVDIIPHGVVVHAPTPAGQAVDSQASRPSQERTHTVEMDV